jgi:hypothetical protein
MLHRLREAMGDETSKLGSDGTSVDVDETFVGGKVINMHKSKREAGKAYQRQGNKTVVMGMLERGGRVKAQVIASILRLCGTSTIMTCRRRPSLAFVAS